MTSRNAILDSSYLVALFDELDSLHSAAVKLRVSLEDHAAQLVLLDVLMGESISVLARRCAERKRGPGLEPVLKRLELHVPPESITWVGQEIRRHYPKILRDVHGSQGRRNFNDALTVIVARTMGVRAIVSFDPDFDDLAQLARLSTPETVAALWGGQVAR